MKLNQRHRHKYTYLWIPDFWQSQNYTMDKANLEGTLLKLHTNTSQCH